MANVANKKWLKIEIDVRVEPGAFPPYEDPVIGADTTDQEPTPVCQSCGHSVGAHDRDGICSLCRDDDVCGAPTPDDMSEPEDSPGEIEVWRGERVGPRRGDY